VLTASIQQKQQQPQAGIGSLQYLTSKKGSSACRRCSYVPYVAAGIHTPLQGTPLQFFVLLAASLHAHNAEGIMRQLPLLNGQHAGPACSHDCYHAEVCKNISSSTSIRVLSINHVNSGMSWQTLMHTSSTFGSPTGVMRQCGAVRSSTLKPAAVAALHQVAQDANGGSSTSLSSKLA